jgi:hypothetical protein
MHLLKEEALCGCKIWPVTWLPWLMFLQVNGSLLEKHFVPKQKLAGKMSYLSLNSKNEIFALWARTCLNVRWIVDFLYSGPNRLPGHYSSSIWADFSCQLHIHHRRPSAQ